MSKPDQVFKQSDLRKRPVNRQPHFNDSSLVRIKRQYKLAGQTAMACFLYSAATCIALNAVLFGNAANLNALPAVGNTLLRSGLFTVALLGGLKFNAAQKVENKQYFEQWLPTSTAHLPRKTFDNELQQEQGCITGLTSAALICPIVAQYFCLSALFSGMEQSAQIVLAGLFLLNSVLDISEQQGNGLQQVTVVLDMPAVPVHRP
ncbi:MAG: hypothetical protein P1U34_00750 [Coxiellaceae bacterium]|nr:hypothetical protein [Coxiellaceae bacterium]